MSDIRNEVIKILVNTLEITESGFSGEQQISGIFKAATEIEAFINKR